MFLERKKGAGENSMSSQCPHQLETLRVLKSPLEGGAEGGGCSFQEYFRFFHSNRRRTKFLNNGFEHVKRESVRKVVILISNQDKARVYMNETVCYTALKIRVSNFL